MEDTSTDAPSAAAFSIVGIGASAGGLQAFEDFFDALPDEPGMPFVLVQHLDPDHESGLAELLQKHTGMSVMQVKDQVDVQVNHVYVIPPGKRLTISGGSLHLSEPVRPRGQRALIDEFFRSLAEEAGERAVCIILSGAGSDGSVGLKRIKEDGGVVMAQDPAEARYDSMPRSALATNLVDLEAPAAELAKKLVEYHDSVDRIQLPDVVEELPEEETDVLRRIFTQLQNWTGHDFSQYKRSTILRRLQRRMQVRRVDDMASYLQHLREAGEEAEALMKDFLISVTNFFRDEEAFETLEKRVIPELFQGKGAGDAVRVWVPGCATGEEAYSIAILLYEQLDAVEARPEIQVFASDIDADALAFAREGIYPEAIVADVSAERLQRFFESEGQHCRVSKPIRDLVLFAEHNLLNDPPFSKLDLLSCRNLLIYLGREIQKDVFQLFHYALNEDGYLFLGGSESVDNTTDLFRAVHKGHRIYRRQGGPKTLPTLSRENAAGEVQEWDEGGRDEDKHVPLGEVHRDLMLQAYAPPSVIVDEDYEIRYLFGDVGRYLRPTEGEPTQHLLEKVSDELRVELRTALFQHFQKGESVEPRRVRATLEDATQVLAVRVDPVRHEDVSRPLALVVFEPEESGEGTPETQGEEASYDVSIVEQLEEELRRTKHRLQTVTEEYETSNEELKASNEELQSMNEELRSTTEELETSKEELQSTNEELHTVNQELKAKVKDLNRTNSDLQNLMESTNIGTLFLDHDLCLKRYTPAAKELFNVIPADVGRPFRHVSHTIDQEDLPARAEHVLRTLETVEEEIKGTEGGYYLMRMRPYRTVEDKIDGVVVTFVDLTERKEAEEEERERARYQAVLGKLRQQALEGSDPERLMDAAVRLVAETLDVEYAKVLELQPDEDALLLRAGIGWQEGYVGTEMVPTDHDSQAGYTLVHDGPVVVENLKQEKRFSGPKLLTEHDVVSGMSVVLQGAAQPYGVFGVHATHQRAFTEQEAHFLQSVADLLGMSIERYQAEAERRESERRYRTALANSPVIFAKANTDLRYEWIFNPHPDFDRDLVKGKRDDEVDAGPGIEALMQLKRDVLEEDRQQRQVITFWRSNGDRTYDFTATPLRDEQGNVTHVITSALDITERRRAEQALEEQEEMLRAVVDQMPSGLSIAEAPSGKLVLHNEEAVRLLRHPLLPSEDYMGYTQYGAVYEDGTSYAPEEYPIARALRGETVYQETMHYRRGDDTRTVMSVNAAPVRNDDGEIVMAVSTFHDISEIKRYEQELEALNETLEQRVRERTRQVRALASSLTLAEQRERHRVAQILHDDLQQLLYGAQMQLAMLKRQLLDGEVDDGSTQFEKVEEILERGVHVARTLTVDLSPPVLDGEGLTEAIQWLATQMKELYDLGVTVAADGPLHIEDEEMRVLLFQLLRELLFNVVKHANVDVAAVVLHQENQHITIEVADEGQGFDIDAVRKDERMQDAGFGLFNVQERLGLFGGHLTIDTAPGEGTTATITVPANPPDNEQD